MSKGKIATVINALMCISLLVLAGCASKPYVKNADSFEQAAASKKSSAISDQLNQQISSLAASSVVERNDLVYRLGAGDVLDLTVFQADELNKTVRVNGRGQIILPLLGAIDAAGKSLVEVEEDIARKLEQEFLQDPQVSLFLTEYRSQQITVMGAVKTPNVYSVRQSRSIFEMLSLAGGLTDIASDKIRVKTKQINPETGQLEQMDLLLSVQQLLEGADAAATIRLRGGDSILVPEAGVVFVEGAVKKPGSYKMEGTTNVLKAIALAGGIPWEGKEAKIQVIREINGEPVSVSVNLDKIRKQREHDISLKDGDVVVVGFSLTKRAISGFFKTAGQIFGYRLD